MGSPMSSDRHLIQAMQAGDAAAFDMLLERHETSVRRCLLRIVNDDAAEDLLQEVFLRLWTRSEQWQGHGALRAWLLRAATNLALNHLRSTRRRRQRPLEPDSQSQEDAEDAEDLVPGWMVDASAVGPDEIAAEAEQRVRIRGLVNTLPEQQREVVRMVSELGLDLADVAEELGIPSGTVKSRLFYARQKLSQELGRRGEPGDSANGQ